MALTREEHLKILRNKMVLLGYIENPAMAHDLGHIDWILTQHFRNRPAQVNPWRTVGQRVRHYREGRFDKTRQEAIDQANRLLADIGDQGFADQSALARIEGGAQRMTYLQGLALERSLGLPYGSFAPWDYDPNIRTYQPQDDPHGP
ncbi:MAG: hypothetical protein AAFO83_00155 [Cyanobacteria bacterium J06607_13]